MTDLFSWSIDLGRWAGSRVRVHCTLVIFAILALLLGITSDTPRFWPTLAWLALLAVVLLLHEAGHLVAAAWSESEAEDVMLWPLGNFVMPSRGRSHENPRVAAGGLIASGLLGWPSRRSWRCGCSGRKMVLKPFGEWPRLGRALRLLGVKDSPRPPMRRCRSSRFGVGWFGWAQLGRLLRQLPASPAVRRRPDRPRHRRAAGPGRVAGHDDPAAWLAHSSAAAYWAWWG